eukprot:8780196-Pyramimonas_sp.AAC.1
MPAAGVHRAARDGGAWVCAIPPVGEPADDHGADVGHDLHDARRPRRRAGEDQSDAGSAGILSRPTIRT